MGMTLAVFSSSGKTPWLREELIVSLSICARLVLRNTCLITAELKSEVEVFFSCLTRSDISDSVQGFRNIEL